MQLPQHIVTVTDVIYIAVPAIVVGLALGFIIGYFARYIDAK